MSNKDQLENLSPEELVQAVVFPHGLNVEEKKILDKEMKKIRFERLTSQTEQQKVFSDLVRLRIQMEDYINASFYNKDKSFGQFLTAYLRIINRNQRSLAKDIGLHYTKLNRILKGKEDANIQLAHRLEKHSGNMISAKLWWKVQIKKIEHSIETDQQLKAKEREKVSNELSFESMSL